MTHLDLRLIAVALTCAAVWLALTFS